MLQQSHLQKTKTVIQKDSRTPMFIVAALFTIAETEAT